MGNKIIIISCILLLSLHSSGKNGFAADKPVVHFGINLRYNPVILYKRYQPLMDYLTQNTPYRFELKISRDYQEAVKFLKEGRTRISSLGDGAFIEAILLHGAVPIVKPLNKDGKPFYRCAIIVPRNSALNSLQNLRGKSIALGSYHSTTGNLIPRYLLAVNGINLQGIGSVASLKNHDAVTKAILKGQYDAGAVKDVFAEKYGEYGLRVLAYSNPIPSVPLVVRSDAPREFVKAVTEALLKLDPRNPDHQKLMENWDEEYKYGFVSADISGYREIFRMFRSIPNGCGMRCHR